MFKSAAAICWYWDPKLKYFESSLVNTIVVKIVILAVASDTSIGAVYLHLNKTPKLSEQDENSSSRKTHSSSSMVAVVVEGVAEY